MGSALSWDSIHHAIAKLCEMRGWHHGVAMPSASDMGHRLILAPGSPLADKKGANTPVALADEHSSATFVCTDTEVNEDYAVPVNCWEVKGKEIQIWKDSKGSLTAQFPAAEMKLKMYIDGVLLRSGALSAESEIRALLALHKRINRVQFDSYILSGAFVETSERSHVTYILRKGLPTLALHLEQVEGGEKRHFLAALCLHPLAYFEDTFCGSYPPTDDVIAHLMLIRTDEHFFWRKAGQHAIDDPRSGI